MRLPKIKNPFKFLKIESKEAKKNKLLVEQYNEGRYLRPDEDVDNKVICSPQTSKEDGVSNAPAISGDNL